MPKTKAQQIAGLLVDYLQSSGQMNELPGIIQALTASGKTQGLVDSAIVTTPVKLSAAELKSIALYVEKNYGEKYQLVEKIDPDLIAGFTIRVGDEVIDASLSSKLEIIRKELVWKKTRPLQPRL